MITQLLALAVYMTSGIDDKKTISGELNVCRHAPILDTLEIEQGLTVKRETKMELRKVLTKFHFLTVFVRAGEIALEYKV